MTYLSTHECAAKLRRSIATIYRLTQRGVAPLPARRLGGTLLFIEAEVETWVANQPQARRGLTLAESGTRMSHAQHPAPVIDPQEINA